MCHGSICCKNILVFKHDDGDIHIKLGDTGMLSIYNKLPISHILNVYKLVTYTFNGQKFFCDKIFFYLYR